MNTNTNENNELTPLVSQPAATTRRSFIKRTASAAMVATLAIGAFDNESLAQLAPGSSHPHYTIKIISANDHVGNTGYNTDVELDSAVMYERPVDFKAMLVTVSGSTEDPDVAWSYPYETMVQNQAVSTGWNINVTYRVGFWEDNNRGELNKGVVILGYITATVNFGVSLKSVHRKEVDIWSSHGADVLIADRTHTAPAFEDPSWGRPRADDPKKGTLILSCENISTTADVVTFKISGTLTWDKKFLDGDAFLSVRNVDAPMNVFQTEFSFKVIAEGMYGADCGVAE